MAKHHNFEMVAQALEKTLVPERSSIVKRCCLKREQTLREFRTIGFLAVRQSGKTQWIFDRVSADPKHSLVIFTNSNFLSEFALRFEGKELLLPPYLRTIAGKVNDRTFSDDFRKEPISHIYIDEASYYFTQHRRFKFYEALVANFNLTEDVIIYLVG